MLFSRKQKGQGLVEYALILVLVAIVVIAALMILGPIIGNTFSTAWFRIPAGARIVMKGEFPHMRHWSLVTYTEAGVPRDGLRAMADGYEAAIRAAGGIDFQLLGIGKTGHIGFNEPGSGAESRTRLVQLDVITRRDAAADFFGEEHVPRAIA